MNNTTSLALIEQQWSDVAERVRGLQPGLANIIDKLGPDSSHGIFKVSYNFGDVMLQQGKLHLPLTNGKLVPFDSPEVPPEIKHRIDYNGGSNPACMVLTGSLEFLFNMPDRNIPFSIVKPGNLCGFWKILDKGSSFCPETFLWEITAGARSLFMLPKISQNGCHSRLKRAMHINTDKPTSINHHWQIFKDIANSETVTEKWTVELLFFSKEWFQHTDDLAWRDFHYFILNLAWKSSGYWRNQYIWDLVFSDIQSRRNIRYSPYIIGIARQALIIAVGEMPGFEPANDDSLAPIALIQQAYIEHYGLKHYAPIIMQPGYYSCYQHDAHPVYYSLQNPTSISYAPKSSKHSTTLQDLYEVGIVLRKYLEELITGKMNISNTPLEKLAHDTEFTLIHSNTSTYKSVEAANIVPVDDPRFLATWINHSENNQFPPNSLFFNGAIRVANYVSK